MKNLILFIVIFVQIPFVSAQKVWEKYHNYSDGNEVPYTVMTAQDGGYFAGGSSRSTGGVQQACIAKIDANGESLWHKTYGNWKQVANLHRNNQGELCAFIVGYNMLQLAKIDETNGEILSFYNVPIDYGIIKIYFDWYYSHVLLPNGDYIISSTRSGTDMSNTNKIFRYTPGASARTWSRDYNNFAPSSLLLDGNNVVACGYGKNADYFNNFKYDIALAKITTDNTVIYEKRYFPDIITVIDKVGLQKNSEGNYLISAVWNENGILAPAIHTISSDTGDYLKRSSITSFNGKDASGISYNIIPYENGFVSAGYLVQDVYDPNNQLRGIGYATLYNISDSGDITGAEIYNTMGGLFSYELNGNTNYKTYQDTGKDCVQTNDGKILLLGSATKRIDDKDEQGYYYIKTGGKGLSVMNVQNKKKISLYPNPVKEILRFSEEVYNIRITDFSGKVVKTVSNNVKSADVANLAKGVYIITATAKSGEVITGKVIKE